MPLLVTMEKLVARCQKRCDMEHDDSISPDEWKEKIDELYGELHSLVAGTGLRYFESTSTITATGATSYALPADCLAHIGVDFLVNGATAGPRDPLRELMAQERDLYGTQTGSRAVGFAVVGQGVFLAPNPPSGVYELLYVPQPADISELDDAETVDLVCEAGRRFLIWGVAVIAKDKSESDLVVAIRERDRAAVDLRAWAAERSVLQPRRRMSDIGDEIERDPADWRRRPL